jgi:putative endonuclease
MATLLPFCVYVLFSEKDHLLYTGFTRGLEARMNDHQAGRNSSTKGRRPLKLIFCEYYLFEEDARKREMYLKTTAGKKALKIMLRNSLSNLGYRGTISPL